MHEPLPCCPALPSAGLQETLGLLSDHLLSPSVLSLCHLPLIKEVVGLT